VFTQVPLQSVGSDAAHPEEQEYEDPDPTQAGVPPVHALPHVPQLDAVVSCTQAPLHATHPLSQANVQLLLTHTAWALATLVVHAWPHVLQLLESLVGSTQLPLQFIDAAAGHPETHEYAPPEPAHTGVDPVHAAPQLPQLVAVVYCAHAPPQRLYPEWQANAHAPAVHVAWALATLVVHALPQLPQLDGPVRSTQSWPQTESPTGQPPSADTRGASSPESSPPPSASLASDPPDDELLTYPTSSVPPLSSGGMVMPASCPGEGGVMSTDWPDAHPIPWIARAPAKAHRRTKRGILMPAILYPAAPEPTSHLAGFAAVCARHVRWHPPSALDVVSPAAYGA